MPRRDEELRRARALLPKTTVAIEARWEGDTSGWFVVLLAIGVRSAASRLAR
jgi:hypothetical protein